MAKSAFFVSKCIGKQNKCLQNITKVLVEYEKVLPLHSIFLQKETNTSKT